MTLLGHLGGSILVLSAFSSPQAEPDDRQHVAPRSPVATLPDGTIPKPKVVEPWRGWDAPAGGAGTSPFARDHATRPDWPLMPPDLGGGGFRGDECAGAIYSNGSYDGYSGLASFVWTDGSFALVADSATFSEDVFITGVNWWTVDSDASQFSEYTLLYFLLPDGPGGEPGTAVYFGYPLATQTDTGVDLFGYNVYFNQIGNVSVPLDSGEYYVVLAPYINAGYYSYWLTADDSGRDFWWYGSYYGYNYWQENYGSIGERNFAYCLLGQGAGPCADAIYQNGAYNEHSAIASQRDTDDAGIHAWAVDDVGPSGAIRINDLHWYACDYFDGGFRFAGRDDVIVLDGSSGSPGSVLVEQSGLANTREDTGDLLFGIYNIYRYDLDDLDIVLIPGTYFIGMRPVQKGYTGYVSYHMFAPLTGYDSYFIADKDDFGGGYTNWTKLEDINPYEATNLSFCITGEPAFDCTAFEDVIWYNGTRDNATGLGSWRCADDPNPYVYTADDVYFYDNYVLTDAHFFSLDASFDYNGSVDVLIYEDDGGKPGSLIDGVYGAKATRDFTGEYWSGSLPIYFYTVKGLSLKPPFGVSWIVLAPVEKSCSGYSYTDTAPAYGYSPYFIAPHLGYNDWTSWYDYSGGVSYGTAFCLTGRLEPAHDYCADLENVLWSSGVYDGYYYLNNCRVKMGGNARDIFTVDDISLDARTTVGDFHWYQFDFSDYGYPFDWDGTADLIVTRYVDATDSPGSTLAAKESVAASRLDTGDYVYGIRVWFYSVDSQSINLRGGRYFIGARPVADTSDFDSYWLTAGSSGASTFFRSKYYGYPDWTSWSDLYGLDLGGVAFCVTGKVRCYCGDSAQDNGVVDFDDIDCFVAALVSYDAWADCTQGAKSNAQYICTNDINADGSVDFDDIDAFVKALVDGYCN